MRGGLLERIAVCLALLTLSTLLSLLVRALGSVCCTTLLTVALRDWTPPVCLLGCCGSGIMLLRSICDIVYISFDFRLAVHRVFTGLAL